MITCLAAIKNENHSSQITGALEMELLWVFFLETEKVKQTASLNETQNTFVEV